MGESWQWPSRNCGRTCQVCLCPGIPIPPYFTRASLNLDKTSSRSRLLSLGSCGRFARSWTASQKQIENFHVFPTSLACFVCSLPDIIASMFHRVLLLCIVVCGLMVSALLAENVVLVGGTIIDGSGKPRTSGVMRI